MIVEYKPETPDRGDPRTWTFNPRRVLSDECELVESHYGMPWDVFVARARLGETKAKRILLWHLMRADHAGPNGHVNLKDVPLFYSGELAVHMEPAEVLEQREAIRKSKALTDAEREAALGAIETEYEEALARAGRRPDGSVDGDTVGATVVDSHDGDAWAAGNPTMGAPAADPLPAASLTSGGATG